ncbi:MAG: hypothetical protein Q8Q12_14785 [bacterium]|nr:hypothetical protein [bacterium]
MKMEEDLHHATFEGQELVVFRPIDLDRQRMQYKGVLFAKLIEKHIRRTSANELLQEYVGSRSLWLKHIPELVLDAFGEKWYQVAQGPDFWRRDCVLVFDDIINGARATFLNAGVSFDDDMLFNTFHWLTLGYAIRATMSKGIRERMGIRMSLFRR